ncbi:MAG: TIGR00282 family metallophosphoesterase [Candidatus Pelagibacter sp.]|nr:TIGR00282 family metallophosphoesterase [Candidatus Pelagibacter sp.]
MNLLILGDIVGISGRNVVKNNLKSIIDAHNIDFVVANGENAADDGKGITKQVAEELFSFGIDVLTSGNHIWDKKDVIGYIDKNDRLLRPANFVAGSPGKGFGIYLSKKKKYKIGVINLIGNVFMKKSDDVFKTANELKSKLQLKKNVDFLVIDFHGEITSEKMAMGHFFDGVSTVVIGTHTHIPTADTRILKNGTAYQTDIGMCGDYDSVIGMNKENSIKRFLRDKNAISNFPAKGEASISGIFIEGNEKNGLADNVRRIVKGGSLE